LKGKIDGSHLRLYDLIFRRFMASQAAEAKIKKRKVKLKVEDFVETRELTAEIVEKGFYQFLRFKPEHLPEGSFKILEKNLRKIPSKLYYTQGTLIEAMKEKGLGRPSTYATIISKLLEHRYVIERGRFLFPTGLGVKVYRYLSERFGDLVSEDFTRKLEEVMDKVERGETSYNENLLNLYRNLKTLLKA